MCCLSQKRIRTFSKCLACNSGLLFVFALGLAYIGFSISSNESLENMGLKDQTLYFGLGLAGTILFIALWGCCVSKYRNKCCLCPFSLVIYIVTVACLIIGIVFVI